MQMETFFSRRSYYSEIPSIDELCVSNSMSVMYFGRAFCHLHVLHTVVEFVVEAFGQDLLRFFAFGTASSNVTSTLTPGPSTTPPEKMLTSPEAGCSRGR